MIKETNFNDIRRNYILASIIFILFLIYWWRVEINKILLFDLSWEWYYFSAFWDVFILLLIFFLYTLFRYLIYWYEKINNNTYKRVLLFEIINNLIIKSWSKVDENNYINKWIEKRLQENNETINDRLNEIHANFNKNIPDRYLWLTFSAEGSSNWYGRNIYLYNVNNINIKRKEISFEFIEVEAFWNTKIILEFSEDIRQFTPSIFKIIFLNKEYSDFIWPLLLALIIYFIFIVRISLFFYS